MTMTATLTLSERRIGIGLYILRQRNMNGQGARRWALMRGGHADVANGHACASREQEQYPAQR